MILNCTGIVKANSSSKLVTLAPRGFRLRAISIPAPIASHLLLDGLAFNGNNQLANVGAVPAELFSNEAVAERFDFDDLEEDDEIELSFTNCSGADKRVWVDLWGSDVDKKADVDVRGADEIYDPMKRRCFLGLGVVSVPGLRDLTIRTQSFWPFHFKRLVVPRRITPFFEWRRTEVEGTDQTVAPSPTDLYDETKLRLGLAWKAVREGMYLSLTFRNRSEEAQDFTGAVVGWCDFHRPSD